MRRGAHTGRAPRLAAVALALLLPLLCAGATHAAVPGHGRTWELVTAGPTNGVRPFTTAAWSDDGTRVVYLSIGPMPGAASGDLVSVNLATRGIDGWVMQPIGEPYSQAAADFEAIQPLAVDSGFSTWVVRSDQPLLPDAPPTPQDAVYRRAPDGTLTLLGQVGNASSDTRFVGASVDARHVVFQGRAHLLPADAARIAGGDAYELDGSELRLVGVDTAGVPPSTCGSLVGNGNPGDDMLTHPVSADGARIWFSAPATSDCGQPRRVYVRINGDQTVEASASACHRADCSPPADVQFAGASRDGAAAFLITTQQLTDDDVDAAADLYRYDVADHALTRLSSGPPGIGADVAGPAVAASDDGTRVYFVASGALVPGYGDPGVPSLYLSDRGRLRFVATIDEPILNRMAISSDGRMLAFATVTALLPSDTDSRADVYRYDAQLGSLQQISLGEGGSGNEQTDVLFGVANPQHPLQQDEKRYMSSDGRRILFMTFERLMADDVNDQRDLYEWVDGTLGLVSSGVGDETLIYEGLSADGSSVFFSTDETLVAADRNGGDYDLYAARLGGGFPDAPPAPAPCSDDACQGPLGPRLLRPAPPTLLPAEPSRHLRIHRLDRHARQRLAQSGHATVLIDVPAPGPVTLLALARVHVRNVVVARDAADPLATGSMRLQLRLGPPARRVLRSGRSLRLTLIVRQGERVSTQLLTLRRPRKP